MSPILQNLVLGVIFFVIGSFLPLALLYVAHYAVRHELNFRSVLGLLARILLIPVVYMVVFAVLALLLNLSGIEPDQIPESSVAWLGFVGGLGLFGGIIALLIGLVRGVRAARQRSREVATSPTP